MRKHEIPRKKKSETRLFIIFSIRSLASTVIGLMAGFFLGNLLKMIIPSAYVFWGTLGFMGIIGFIIGTIPIFVIPWIPTTRTVQGLYVYQVVLLYLKYRQKRSLKVQIKGDR